MLTSTSTSAASLAAIRNRRYRRRQREELSIAHSEVPWRFIEHLIAQGRITEAEAADPNRLGEVILAEAQENLKVSGTA